MADLHALNEDRQDAWRERQRDEYREYLESDRWKKMRKAAELRAKGKCEICQRRDGRTLAHLGYERIFAERLVDVLWTCWPCHKELDGK